MRRMLLIPLALLAALLVATAAGANTQTVQITKNGFTPAQASITVGDTVTWHNADTGDHQIVANDGTFASPVLHPDQSYSHTFQQAGKWTYYDAFAKSHTGSVTVTGPPDSVTLNASSTTIVYGGSTTLTGAVTNQLTAGEPVLLEAQTFGKAIQSVDSTTTSSTGAFNFVESPTIQTTYQAHWRTTNSSQIVVDVAPRVGFGLSGKRFVAKVTSDITYGGHFVWVQRHVPSGWINIKRVTLGSNSSALFTLRLPHRNVTTLRLLLPSGQAGAGYVMGVSRAIAVRR
jgi:plastocyanin